MAGDENNTYGEIVFADSRAKVERIYSEEPVVANVSKEVFLGKYHKKSMLENIDKTERTDVIPVAKVKQDELGMER